MVDTNVLISAGLKADSLPRRVVEWIIDRGQLLASDATLAEFESRYLTRSKFDRYASPELREPFVAAVSANMEMVDVSLSLAISPDPDDNRFLELAVGARADAIVTGNMKHFPDAVDGIPVLTPAAFRDRFMGP